MDEYFKYPGQSFEDRINWVKALVLFIVFLILLRGVYLQVIDHDRMDRMAQEKLRKIKAVSVQRGKIIDAEGEILAMSLPIYSVFAYPDKIKDPEKTAKALSAVLEQKISADFLKSAEGFTWIQRSISDAQYSALSKADLPGIYFQSEFMRVYPRNYTASQLIGLVGLDSVGLGGVEYRYNKDMMGLNYDNSDRDQLLDFYSQGNDIQLTISQKIQYFTERSLQNSVIESQSQSGIAIVMETKTGAILAMAGYPSFNPNRYRQFNKDLYVNTAVNTAYEPGSTFKIITMAIARQLDLIKPETQLFCENGSYRVADKTIRDVHQYGLLGLSDIIKFSSNICMLKIGAMIPAETFYQKIREFGFGEETGIDLPGESQGVVHSYKSWSELDQATISFGHSIQVTPIQLISAINIVANKGVYVSPYVVSRIINPEGVNTHTPQQTTKQILDEDIAAEITRYMTAVTDKDGTGGSAAIKGLSVAGKTGTTKKFDKVRKEYSSQNHIRSFVGFLPADEPVLTILAILNEPREKYQDSLTAAPMFKEIAVNAYRFFTKKQSATVAQDEYDPSGLFGKMQKVSSADKLKDKTLREVLYYGSLQKNKLSVVGSGKVKSVGYVSADRLTVVMD